MRPRQIAPVALVLGVSVAGFFGAQSLGERGAHRNSERRAAVAAAQIRARVEQGVSLAESLRRLMMGEAGNGITIQDFQRNTSRWLSPAGFPAAGWVERVAAGRRAAYERRTGNPIVIRDRGGRIAPAPPRSSYLPATLVSGTPPMAVPGIDLGGESGMAAAVTGATPLRAARATPLDTQRNGTKGLFLVTSGPRVTRGVVEPGFVVVFVPDLLLRGAATETKTLRLTVGDTSTGAPVGGNPVHKAFTTAGQRFDVVVPQRPVQGAAAALPWIIFVAGVILAAFAGALGIIAARRVKTQDELDRIFTLSHDLIAVSDFEGHFTRVNPAVRNVLGYTEEELLARPYLDFVHPDDRERTAAETAALGEGKATLSFENRLVCKDGSSRALEWTSVPVVQDGLIYSVARDVSERRAAEAELERLAGEQASLRRVATLVARGVPAAEVFSAVAQEFERLFDAQATVVARVEPDGTMSVVGSGGRASNQVPVGSNLTLESEMLLAKVVRSGRSARVDDYSPASGLATDRMQGMGIRCSLGVPIMVEGSLWGAMGAATDREQFPADTEQRMAKFTELVATAISNIQARSDLAASRARIGAAADDERRRVVRDLHDGAQQRLVHTIITLKLASQALEQGGDAVEGHLAEALGQAEAAIADLRELAHGILPAVLTRGGLRAGVQALAARMPVPVDIDVAVERFPAGIEATAYFVVAEALTNVAKHSHASAAGVTARVQDGALRIEVRDDGIGGARTDGTGLVGLADRLAVLESRLRIESPTGGGTVVAADIILAGSGRTASES